MSELADSIGTAAMALSERWKEHETGICDASNTLFAVFDFLVKAKPRDLRRLRTKIARHSRACSAVLGTLALRNKEEITRCA